jgi:hypothetical protein
MSGADPWTTLNKGECLLGIPTISRFFAVDTGASPMCGRAHYGYAVLLPSLILAPMALLAWKVHEHNGAMLFAALAAIGPVLSVFCRTRVVITDDKVRVVARVLWRKSVFEEPRSNYVALRYKLLRRNGGWISWTGHILLLEHASRPERSLPVFWSTDFADVARWQTRLATALGVATMEIAGGNTQVVAPIDIERPLAERPPPAKATSRPGAPAADLAVEHSGDRTDVTLPQPPRSFKGAVIATALLALPLVAAFAMIRDLSPGFLLGAAALFVVVMILGNGVSRIGSTEPHQIRRLSLSPDSLGLHWRGWMARPVSAHHPWHRVLATEIGPGPWGGKDVLTIRTANACYVTPPGLSRPALDWLKTAITAAAQHGTEK